MGIGGLGSSRSKFWIKTLRARCSGEDRDRAQIHPKPGAPIYNEYGGRSDPSCGGTGEPLIVDDGEAIYLEALLEAIPSIYLDEIKFKLEKNRNVSILMSTISRFLWKLELAWKPMTREASERYQQLRACYEAETACYDEPSYFVFIDESHVAHEEPRCKDGGL